MRSLNHLEQYFLQLVSHNNAIPILTVRYENRINNELFKKALSFVVKQNDLLNSNITELNGTYFIKYKNCSSVIYEYRESNKNLLHNDIDVTEVSKLDSFILFIILNNIKNSSEVVLCYNHSLFDGVSINNLMEDIYKSYNALTNNETLIIQPRLINKDLLEISDRVSSSKLLFDYYLNNLQTSLNIFFRFIESIHQYYLDDNFKYVTDKEYNNTTLSIDPNLYKKFQINSFEKLNYLKTNKDYSETNYLSSVRFKRSNYRSISNLCRKNNINIFSYLCALLADVLHVNYSNSWRQDIKIQTFINLRNHKNFSYTSKDQGLLICPYFVNLECSQENNILKNSKNIFDKLSIFTEQVSPNYINEIYRIGNETLDLFYKGYLDLTKFDTNHIDLGVNNLGVIKQFENFKMGKYEAMIFFKTDLLPKIYLYFVTNQNEELFLSLSSSRIHKLDHKKIFDEIVERFENISIEEE